MVSDGMIGLMSRVRAIFESAPQDKVASYMGNFRADMDAAIVPLFSSQILESSIAWDAAKYVYPLDTKEEVLWRLFSVANDNSLDDPNVHEPKTEAMAPSLAPLR